LQPWCIALITISIVLFYNIKTRIIVVTCYHCYCHLHPSAYRYLCPTEHCKSMMVSAQSQELASKAECLAWPVPYPTVACHSDVTIATHLDNAVRKLEAKLDTDGLQVAFAPLLDAVLHHVCNHCDQHVQRVQLVPAPLQHPSA